MDEEQLKVKTKQFAKQVIGLCRSLPETRDGRLIGNQLFRSGTSIGANYRAACRARSKADFISKLGIALEEADESLYWLEILEETQVVQPTITAPLKREAASLVAILVASLNTSKQNPK